MQTLAYSNITVLIEVIHLYHTFMNLMGGGVCLLPTICTKSGVLWKKTVIMFVEPLFANLIIQVSLICTP